MSRIENSMEKAARLREGKAGAEGVAGSAPHPGDAAGAPQGSHPSMSLGKLSPKNPFLVNLNDPFSATAEEYRKLKWALVELSKGRDFFKSAVVITSSVPSEGKSITALNLAMSLAQEHDHTVLLIDADLRKPALHRYLEIEQGPGLADLVQGKAQLADTIIDTGIGKLSIMRAGSQTDSPSELFSSARIKGVIEQLKHAYPERYLIFDTPPVLPFAETRSLARLVDGVLFVVRERLASEANVQEALESLKGCHIFGAVYNAALLATHEERYSHYHGYYSKPGKKSPAGATAGAPSSDGVPSL